MAYEVHVTTVSTCPTAVVAAATTLHRGPYERLDDAMSLDGFIAFRDDDVGPLFDWYRVGPVETPSASESWSYRTDEKSAGYLREALRRVGALVCGRRLFEHTHGWGGRHPVGCPVIVVSHSVPEGWPREGVPFHFVTDGVENAIGLAKRIAGDRVVAVATPSITQQCLNLGLLDVIRVNLAPVLLGDGIPFFANLADAPILLDSDQLGSRHPQPGPDPAHPPAGLVHDHHQAAADRGHQRPVGGPAVLPQTGQRLWRFLADRVVGAGRPGPPSASPTSPAR